MARRVESAMEEDQAMGEQAYVAAENQGYMMPTSETADDGSGAGGAVLPSEVTMTTDVPVAAAEEAPSVVEATVLSEPQLDGNSSAAVENPSDVQPQLEEPAVLTEEDRLWNIVKANPADFAAWTSLIQEVDKLEILERIHRVYDTFLAEFPLCYGYWKKYADHEIRGGTHESTIAVYERAVQAVTYSVDIWMHYCSYLISKQEDPDEVRRLFERGLSYVGSDYMSHILWDKYLEFEVGLNEINKISQLYTRIIQLPIQKLDHYYHSYKQFIALHTLNELQSDEERAASSAAALATTTIETTSNTEAGPAEGAGAEEGNSTSASKVDGSVKPDQGLEWSEESELSKFNYLRDELYKAAKEQDARIAEYETAIRRPYFHVKPLDDAQLANWHRYLDFMEKDGDFAKVVKLYERCLIACANYPEYWIRYVLHMDLQGSMEYAVDALTRASQIFVKRRPEIHLFSARFKEEHGDIEGARYEYQILNSSLAPGLLESIVRTANFEHRQGNTEGACAVFTSAIEYEKSKEESRSLPFLFIQYARFLDQVAENTEKAREVYADALAFLPLSKTLWEALIHFEAYRSGPKDMDRLESLIEEATAAPKPDVPGLSAIDKEEISSIYLEFVDLFGDLQRLRKAEARHRQLFPLRKNSESRKRPSPDGSGSDRAKMLKVHGSSTLSPAQAAAPAYANGQTQWGAGYGQQGYAQPPQTWQQPPAQQAQVQQQQWTPAYSSQPAGYNAYGNYGAYGATQQQAVPPPQQQPAAYSSYAQGYTPQAFPQQPGYAQQPAYTQQQAPVQQGYYPAYY
ncbi:hypothetical protein GOP47_0013253 [Adiantum capillus-veneris]|uniref:Pre-mRNA-processing factor 39 n=1 Tax=Adiantum capillus-veneris TaxID=13818 RepID=A0A9D4ZED1_ADICA|nr:hypothetical protein GOP47_0013253 [Adiantum capillus-veneris]